MRRVFSAAISLAVLVASPSAWAQSSSAAASAASDPFAAEVLRTLQQRGGGQTTAPVEPTIQIQNPQVYRSPDMPLFPGTQPPRISDQTEVAPSALERLMTQRAGLRVRQFGYDVFGQPGAVVVRQSGALQDNYVLGPGDEIAVTFRGQENASYRTRVDRDGRVVLPGLPPVGAGGRAFGAFRSDLEAAVAHAFAGTEATVSVGAVRQISVRVVGEVNTPGAYSVSGLSTAMDALSLAGGIKKTGSLRGVEIVRGSRIIHLDLYTLLAGKPGAADVTLTDGDRIVVPLYGKSVALVGQVKRPAIYELAPHRDTMGTQELLALAGGPEIRGRYRFSVLRTREDGRREMVQTNPQSNVLIHDGDVVFVAAAADVSTDRVQLMGASKLAGFYPLHPGGTMHDLLRSSDMFAPVVGSPLPYLLIGAIIRLDPQTVQRTVIPFSPVDVTIGKSNVALQSNDVVYILNIAEMRYIAKRMSERKEPTLLQTTEQNTTLRPERDQEQSLIAQQRQTTTMGLLQTAPSGASSGMNQRSTMTDRPLLDPMQDQRSQQTLDDENEIQPALPRTATQDEGPAPTEDALLNPGIVAPQYRRPSETYPMQTGDTMQPLGAQQSSGEPTQERLLGTQRLRRPTRELRLFVGLDDDARRLLVGTLGNYLVTVTGEVNDPGNFLAMPETTLDHLVNAAGGMTPKVDLKAFEITSTEVDNASGTSRTVHKTYDLSTSQMSQVTLRPLDRVRFNAVFSDRDTGDVSVYGQVKYPGAYEITRGEHLSAVLARAGGFTGAAYPAGAIFLRRSVAEQERGVLQREGDELESQLVGLLGSDSKRNPISESEIAYINHMVEKLRDSTGQGGRVAVQIDPREVLAHPELDITLEPGDQLFVPRKPSSVIVAGEVMSPGGIQYRADLSVSDYVALAGGITEVADDDHIFVIRPDGSAVQAESGWASPFDSTRLAPGSVIVVPRTLRHFTWDTLVENIVQVTSQLAVTAASLSVVLR